MRILSYSEHPGNIHESKSFFELYSSVKELPELEPPKMVLDAGYKTPQIAKRLIEDGIEPLLTYKRLMTREGFFRKYEYAYVEHYDCFICPNDTVLRYNTTNRNGYREYKSDPKICLDCTLRAHCTQSQDLTKIVNRHVWQDFMERAVEIRQTLGHLEIYKIRKETIERSFRTCKESHGMRYTNYRGGDQVDIQIAMTLSVYYLLKIVRYYPPDKA